MSSLDVSFITSLPLLEVAQVQQNFVARFAASIAADNDAVTDEEYQGLSKPSSPSVVGAQNKPCNPPANL